MTMRMNDEFLYRLPQYKDNEGHFVNIIIKPDSLKDFITVDDSEGTLLFKPTLISHLGP